MFGAMTQPVRKMFGWFKKRIAQAEGRSTAELFDAVGRLGELMENYPMHVLDVSSLPMPKPQMKTILKEAWRVATPDHRRAIELGYLHLANFQNGVGPTPISLSLGDDDPINAMSRLDATLAWIKKTSAEVEALSGELDAFKRDVE
jgi:hypothetical protein